MSKFSEQVHISIGGFTQNVIYYDLQLSQKMADHHHFSFLWQYTGKPIIEPEDQEKAFRNYIGSEVIFTFKVNGIRLMSKGKIRRLDSIDLHGSAPGLHVTGVSHTIAIDEMKKSRIFLEKNLQQIALEILAEESSGEFYQRESIVPTYTREFKFKTQYNETNFTFLKRLSVRYGQWFYFDGMRMQFGKIKNSKVKLINESSLHKFRIEAHLVSHKTSFGGYDSTNAVNIKSASEKTETGSRDSFASMVNFKQTHIAQHGLKNGAYTNNAQNKDEIEQMVKLQTAGYDANSIFYRGTSYLPIGLGQIFTIQNKTVEHELVAIEVIHHSEINGNYSCEFKAIPADVAAPHYTDVTTFATAESQSAIVKDNNDPEGMGRIKVDFYWSGWGNTSEWMRMIQPHSGSGKGFYFIPEIGEEVLVGFEGGNVDCPFVMGTQYNGQASSGYNTPKNDLKVIRTRSGIIIILNDADGSVLIQDPSGNKYFMDGNGNIELEAPKNMTFNAGEDINMNAGQNMTTTIGLNKTDTIGGNHTESITGSKTISIGINFMLNVIGNMAEWIQGNKETESKDIKEMAQEVLLNSVEKSINVRGAKNVNNHSGETSKNG